MDHLLELLYSVHDDFDLQMIQHWLVVAPYSTIYTVSNVLFHRYGGMNVTLKDYMSHFSMFVLTKSTVKFPNENTGHTQGIGIFLCHFPDCPIIYTVVPVCYCPCNPSYTISSGALKFYVGFQKVTSDPPQHFYFVDHQGRSWRSPSQTQNNLDYLQIEIFKFNPKINSNIFVTTVCYLSKHNLSLLIHQQFGNVFIAKLKRMARKGPMECIPKNISGMEEPYHICLWIKTTKIPRGLTIDVSKFVPGFMLQMEFEFFNI